MSEGIMSDGPAPRDVRSLVAEHFQELYRYAFRLSGSAHDAEDLTQQTFLQAQRKLQQLRDARAARAWLFAILRNCYLRSREKPQVEAASSLSLALDTIPDELPDELEFDPAELQAALDELPDDHKLVLLLFYFENCSYREMAERLNIPLGTVMSRLSRAKHRLRSRLLAPAAAPLHSTRTLPR